MFSIKNWYGKSLFAKIPPTFAAASIIISGFSIVIKFLTASWFRRSKSLLEAPIKLVYPLLDNTLQIADPTIPLWPAIYILEFKFIYKKRF